MAARRFAPVLGLVAVGVLAVVAAKYFFAGDAIQDADAASGSLRSPAATSPIAPAAAPADAGDRDANGAAPSEAERALDLPAATPDDASRARAVWFGRVVDERRFPVADATVTLRLFRNGALELPNAKSGADGRFEIAAPPERPNRWIENSVSAVDARGRFAFTKFWSQAGIEGEPPPRTDVGTLALRDGATLRIAVTSNGGAAPRARVHLEMGKERTRVLESTADDQGRVVLRGVPLDDVLVVASAEGGRGRTRVTPVSAPQNAEPAISVNVELRPLRALDVAVLDGADDAPIAGATVTLEESVFWLQDRFSSFPEISFSSRPLELAEAKTDASGHARVDDLDEGTRAIVHADAEGYRGDLWHDDGSHVEVPESATTVTLRLKRDGVRTARWPAAAGSAPVPPPGSEVRMRPWQARVDGSSKSKPLTGRMDGTDLVVEQAPSGTLALVAEAQDGSVATAWLGENATTGDAIRFKRGIKVEVVVHDPTGAPVRDVAVQLRDQGGSPVLPTAKTGADGVALFERLTEGLVNVYVSTKSPLIPEESAGALKLGEEDARLECTLRGTTVTSEAIVQVELDGVPGLPSDYALTPGRDAKIVDSVEDPEHGRIRVRLSGTNADAAPQIWMRAIGYLPDHVELSTTQVDPPPVVTLALTRAGSLLAHVVKNDKARASLVCQRWNESKRAWEKLPSQYSAMRWPNGPDDGYLFEPIAAGRHCVFDETSGVTSEAVDVVAGARATVALDLTRVVELSGRVELPDGEDAAFARVILDDGRHATDAEATESRRGGALPGVGVAKDGAFRLTASSVPPPRLRAWHPWLRPAADGGAVTVADAKQPVTLRLERAPLVSFTPRLAGRTAPERMGVFLVPVPADGAEIRKCTAFLHDGALRFLAPEPATFTLWIDPGGSLAPVVRKERFTGLDVDLGEIEFGPGSTLHAVLHARPGVSVPRIYVFVFALDGPKYDRQMNSNGESEALVHGLGPGRFEVSAGAIMDSTVLYHGTIEVDGVNDVTISIDLK